jgi:hypothetical protein
MKFAQWRRSSSATLIKQNRTIKVGVKKTSVSNATAAARPSMQKQHRYPIGITALFPIKIMQG